MEKSVAGKVPLNPATNLSVILGFSKQFSMLWADLAMGSGGQYRNDRMSGMGVQSEFNLLGSLKSSWRIGLFGIASDGSRKPCKYCG